MRELEKQLEDAQMKNIALETMIANSRAFVTTDVRKMDFCHPELVSGLQIHRGDAETG